MPKEKVDHGKAAVRAAQEEITKALGEASASTAPAETRTFILVRGLCYALNRVLQHAEKDME
jgi:hypothetical protein